MERLTKRSDLYEVVMSLFLGHLAAEVLAEARMANHPSRHSYHLPAPRSLLSQAVMIDWSKKVDRQIHQMYLLCRQLAVQSVRAKKAMLHFYHRSLYRFLRRASLLRTPSDP